VSNDNARSERHDPSISPKGTVIVRAGTDIFRGRISNLSRAAVSMHTRITAPERLLDSVVDIDLRFDGRGSSWFRLQGHILRIGAGSIALELDLVSPTFARIVDEMVTASHCHHRVMSIVLVDAMPERRSAMAEAFRAVGCAVIDVSTPLEAIVRLGESPFEPNLIAIADSLPGTISDELRRFVDAEHPRAKLVTISDATSAPVGPAHWLSTANPVNDLAARIRSVLIAHA
jgi:CheY-like chemotaxis protein